MNANRHLHFIHLKCHLNFLGYRVVCVLFFQTLMCQSMRDFVFSLHKLYYMPNSKSCMSIDVQFFVCQMSKTYKNFVKSARIIESYKFILESRERERERLVLKFALVVASHDYILGATRTNVHCLIMVWLSTLKIPNTPTYPPTQPITTSNCDP